MRANLLCGRGGVSHLVDEDTRHSLPIGQMGNYQDYLKKQPLPLRELESAPVRQHMFGNPFKTNKNLMMMTDEVSGLGGVDEVQIVNAGGQTPVSGGTVGGLQHLGRGLKRPAEQLLAAQQQRAAVDLQGGEAAGPLSCPPVEDAGGTPWTALGQEAVHSRGEAGGAQVRISYTSQRFIPC